MDPEIEAFLERVKARRDKEQTVRGRVKDIEDFAAFLAEQDIDLSDVGRTTVVDYITELGNRGLAPSVVSSRRWSLNVLLNEMVGRDVLEENPMEDVDWSKYRNLFNGTKKADYVDARGGIYALDGEAVQRLADHADSLREEFVILLMYHTGVRVSELVGMKVDDVDRDKREIEIYCPKLDSDYADKSPYQKVWYGPSLDSYFRRWLDYGERGQYRPADDSPYLFITQRSEKLAIKTVNRWIKEAASEAGLQEIMYIDNNGNKRHLITSHTLRHSFARSCMVGNDGGRIDLKTLADLMNHSKTDSTEKYLHFAEDDVREARQRYGPR